MLAVLALGLSAFVLAMTAASARRGTTRRETPSSIGRWAIALVVPVALMVIAARAYRLDCRSTRVAGAVTLCPVSDDQSTDAYRSTFSVRWGPSVFHEQVPWAFVALLAVSAATYLVAVARVRRSNDRADSSVVRTAAAAGSVALSLYVVAWSADRLSDALVVSTSALGLSIEPWRIVVIGTVGAAALLVGAVAAWRLLIGAREEVPVRDAAPV